MSTSGADFTHYHGRTVGSFTAAERKESLGSIVNERRAIETAKREEAERISAEKHAAFLEGFREHIRNDDRYTAEEKAEIIQASFSW
jgi:MoxR-like ATPase